MLRIAILEGFSQLGLQIAKVSIQIRNPKQVVRTNWLQFAHLTDQ